MATGCGVGHGVGAGPDLEGGSVAADVGRAVAVALGTADGDGAGPPLAATWAGLTAEEIALGYKQLLQVERGWRDMKTTLELRPVYHRKQERIRAHIVLCWLALLLIRVAENRTQDTWRNLRHELQQLHLVTLATDRGTVAQRSLLTVGQQAILTRLEMPEPPRFYDFKPAAA